MLHKMVMFELDNTGTITARYQAGFTLVKKELGYTYIYCTGATWWQAHGEFWRQINYNEVPHFVKIYMLLTGD